MNTTEKTKKARKPVRRAEKWSAQVLPMTGKLLLIVAAAVVLGLMFSALQGVPVFWLRMLITVAVGAGILLMLYNEGLTWGLRDAEASHLAARQLKEGKTLTRQEDAMCFHPLKAICAAGLIFGIPLVLSVYLAVTAEPYTYVLQDLPTWVSGVYNTRSDVIAPLAGYMQEITMGVKDVLRMIVRLVELVYVNFFADPQKMIQTIDRLSPLMVATYPLAYVLGYLSGPASYGKKRSMQRKAKKVAQRKADRNKMADELLGEGKQVHYGQKAGEHKKKELI